METLREAKTHFVEAKDTFFAKVRSLFNLKAHVQATEDEISLILTQQSLDKTLEKKLALEDTFVGLSLSETLGRLIELGK